MRACARICARVRARLRTVRLDEVRRSDGLSIGAGFSRLTFSAQVGRNVTHWTSSTTLCDPWSEWHFHIIAYRLWFWSGVNVLTRTGGFALFPPT